MARSYAGLVNMDGSQHLGMPVRYLLKDNDGVILFRSLEEVERKLSTMADEPPKRRTGSENLDRW